MTDSKEHLEFINQMLSEAEPFPKKSKSDSISSIPSETEILELGNGFNFDGFEVVRREFFAHTHEPSVCFNNCRFYVNSTCLQKFPDTDYVQVLVNKKTKILAIMPCPENARDSFVWCTAANGKRKPKQITAKLFFAKVASMMNWNPDYRYKILGKLIHANGEYLIAFDLTSTETYQRSFTEGAKPKTSRIPVFPAEWQNQFGLPYNEHKQSLHVNVLDGYVVYSLKDDSPESSSEQNSVSPEEPSPVPEEAPVTNS